jgi:hypothetical protein
MFGKLKRKRVVRFLGLLSDEIDDVENLYKLCRHVHISRSSFNRRYIDAPDLTQATKFTFSRIH